MQPSAPSDPHLAALAAQNARVRSLALAIARDAHVADDLAQDAWIALLRHRPEDSSSLSGWLAKTMRNLLRRGAPMLANSELSTGQRHWKMQDAPRSAFHRFTSHSVGAQNRTLLRH